MLAAYANFLIKKRPPNLAAFAQALTTNYYLAIISFLVITIPFLHIALMI
jgi:hypothetical protein